MNKSTLGLLAVFVLAAGVLAHSGEAFAISYKNETSSTDKKMEDDKMKASEKRQKDDTTKKSDNKSIGKTQKAMKHKATTIKKQRLAQGIKP
ncbi:MAG: hypothetical protein EB170_06845 [Nitrosopumilaceae archaeon]|nr:hypothetical protein [Nitrosopumilaceae archaeon]